MTASMPDPATVPSLRLEPLHVLVFGVLTCGLYFLWWNARVARVLNAVAGRELLSPVLASLASLCGPLHLYFYYVVGESLPLLATSVGRSERRPDRTTPLLVLGFLFAPVAAMIVQRQLNEYFDGPS
jgi:hypothetical protein